MNCASIITASVGFQDAKITSVKVGGVANKIGSMNGYDVVIFIVLNHL